MDFSCFRCLQKALPALLVSLLAVSLLLPFPCFLHLECSCFFLWDFFSPQADPVSTLFSQSSSPARGCFALTHPIHFPCAAPTNPLELFFPYVIFSQRIPLSSSLQAPCPNSWPSSLEHSSPLSSLSQIPSVCSCFFRRATPASQDRPQFPRIKPGTFSRGRREERKLPPATPGMQMRDNEMQIFGRFRNKKSKWPLPKYPSKHKRLEMFGNSTGKAEPECLENAGLKHFSKAQGQV